MIFPDGGRFFFCTSQRRPKKPWLVETDFAWEFGHQIHLAHSFFQDKCWAFKALPGPEFILHGSLVRVWPSGVQTWTSDQNSPQRANKVGISNQSSESSDQYRSVRSCIFGCSYLWMQLHSNSHCRCWRRWYISPFLRALERQTQPWDWSCQLHQEQMRPFGGFHKWGTPIAGWLISWKIPWTWMRTGGTLISGNLHLKDCAQFNCSTVALWLCMMLWCPVFQDVQQKRTAPIFCSFAF